MKAVTTILVVLLACTRLAQQQTPPTTGLYFMLNGNIYLPGDSVIISDIGVQPGTRSDAGSTLICVTSNVNTQCCRGSDHPGSGSLGNWFYPDGSQVPVPGDETSMDTFTRVVFTKQVRLARLSGTPTEPLGAYTCEVPNGSDGTASANITLIAPPATTTSGPTTVMATSAMPTTPESTTPMATTPTTSMAISETTAMVEESTSETSSSEASTAMSETVPTEAVTTSTNVTGPTPVVTVSPSSLTALEGSEVILNCSSNITGVFSWSGPGGELTSTSDDITIDDTSNAVSILTISSALVSHAGSYTCEVITDGGVSQTDSADIVVQLSPPSSISVTSPVTLVSSPVTLTCTISLTSMLDSGVLVVVVWTGPDGSPLSNGSTPSGSGTMYTNIITVNDLDDSAAGTNYTCTASLNTSLDSVIPSTSVSGSGTISLQLNTPESVEVTLPSSRNGGSLDLSCSITLRSAIPTGVALNVTWTGPDGSSLSTGTTPTGSDVLYSSVLSLSSLTVFDAGTYTCSVSLVSNRPPYLISGTSISGANNVSVQLGAPASVVVSSSSSSPSAGDPLSLTCSIMLSSEVISGISLEVIWTLPDSTTIMADSSGTSATLTGTGTSYTSVLNISSLTASHAGMYTCSATLISSLQYVTNSVSTVGANNVTIKVRAPSSVMVSSPTVFAGRSFSILCTIELFEELSSGIELLVVWTGPDGSDLAGTEIMHNSTFYTSTTLMETAGDTSGGNYTCSVALESSVMFLTNSDITRRTISISLVSPPSSPTITEAAAKSINPKSIISLTWTQPDGEVVDSYIISYSFMVSGCVGSPGATGNNVMVSGINGTLRSYSLTNLEENTEYTISMSAVNGAGASAMSSTITNHTPVAGPSAAPVLTVTSTTSTSISIAWDEVPCLQRNGEIFRYIVSYCPTGATSCPRPRPPIMATEPRVLTISGLIPRTSYDIAIRADSQDINFIAHNGVLSAPLTNETSVPQALGFFLKGMLYSPNVAVSLTDIGSDSDALMCLTNLTQCCRGVDANDAGAMGSWRFPNGSIVGSQRDGGSISRTRGPSSVLLHRINNAISPTGIYTCVIPDADNVNMDLNIYLYGDQEPVLSTSLVYSRELSQLVCTSSGGIVVAVRWSKDDLQVTDGTIFTQSATVIDQSTATYELVLSGNISDFVGRFTCEVTYGDQRTLSATLEINGVVVRSSPVSPLVVGDNATLTCTNDAGVADLIEWRSSDGTVLTSNTSVRMLQLFLSPVNDSLPVLGTEFTCYVNRSGIIVTQNQPVTVSVPSPMIDATISISGSSVAGSEYNLTCVVLELYPGLTGSVMILWMAGQGQLPGSVSVSTSFSEGGGVSVLNINPLRTSYPTIYTCHGTYFSPVDNTSTTAEQTRTVVIQIAAPAVAVSVSSGPLVAGGVDDVTLTCTATLDTSVVDFGVFEYTFTWLDRDNRTVNSDSRINIVSDTRSDSSTLTLSPLSVVDTEFTCEVVVSENQNRLQASPNGVGSTSVNVQAPDPPIVSIGSNGSSVAGEPYTLTCSISLQQNLRQSPVIEWIGPDGPVIDSETLVDMSLISSSTSMTLLFSPLHTSHGGIYWCRASVTDAAAGINIMNNSSVTVTVQVPPPMVTITGAPIDEGFHIGLKLVFTGRAVFNSAVDTPTSLMVSSTWSSPRSGTAMSAKQENENPITYIAVLEVELQNTTTDSGSYTVTFNISSSSSFIVGIIVVGFRDIMVQPFPPQIVQIVLESEAVAGSDHSVECRATRRDTLANTTTLDIYWLDINNDLITSSKSVTEIITNSTDTNITSTLTFTNVRTSQAGIYTCVVNMTIPGVVQDHQVRKTTTVFVMISAATAVDLSATRLAPWYWGTTVTLTCIVNYDTQLVDTPVTFNINITGPATINITTGLTTNTTSATIAPLLPEHNGSYECWSSIIPSNHTPFVRTVINDPSKPLPLQLTELPPPVVSVSFPPVTEAGQSLSITCTVSVVEYLIVTPQVDWIQPNGTVITSASVNPSLNEGEFGTTSTRNFSFIPVQTSHAGRYTCAARINIQVLPGAYNSSNVTIVIVQIPVPVISILNVSAAQGTVASLQAEATVNQGIVDSPFQFSGTWTLSSGSRLDMDRISISNSNVEVSPYSSILTFTPLRSSSEDGGMYVFSVTVEPSANTEYILYSTANETVMLSVQPYPQLNISRDIKTAQCMPAEGATLSGSISLLNNTYSDRTVSYTWTGEGVTERTQSDNLLSSSFTITLAENSMVEYRLEVCLNVSRSGLLNHCSRARYELTVMKPEVVKELQCSTTGDSLSILWSPPENGPAVSYQVSVLEYIQSQGSSIVTTRELSSPFLEQTSGLQVQSPSLQKFVPYAVIVMSLDSARCGEARNITCFTEQGVPTKAPEDVEVSRDENDPTVLLVTWKPLTIVEAQGFINYTVVAAASSRKRQEQSLSQTVPGDAGSARLTGADPSVSYVVSVTPVTQSGQRVQGSSSQPLPPVPTSGSSVGVIIAVIIVVLVVLIIIAVAILVGFFLYRKYKTPKKGLYSPGHYTATPLANPYDSLEMKFKDLNDNNDMSKEMEANLSTEVVPEPEPMPVAVAPVEVMDRMKPVSLESFRDHVVSKHNERDKGFETEYQSFGSDPQSPHTVAKIPHNRVKNRFANIFPYDSSRVVLPSIPNVEGSDYINACTIDGYNREGCYIAAQGPMPNTEEDFWRMIWEMKITNIVMLTKCLEAGRRKCEQYWAENMGDVYNTPDKMFSVTTTSVMPFADFVIRTFTVKRRDVPDKEAKVSQYHFTSWPDHGVPKFATSLLSFIRRVQKEHNKDLGIPLLVHCSAGVGRTGTFITLDAMLERIRSEESVNVYEFVKNMRKRRVLMVQTMAQYVFIHDALNEFITCGDTEIRANSLRARVNYLAKVMPGKGITGFTHQFQLLEQVSRKPLEEDCTDAAEHYNRDKNRYPDKPPYNLSRARLRPSGEEGSEYINASFIDGYKQRNAYIATQGPLPNTVADLWRMMWEFKSKTLVTLCQTIERGVEVCHQFWPSTENDPQRYGKITVTLQSSTNYDDFEVRKFQLQDEKAATGSPKSDSNFVVTQFHHMNWHEDGSPSTGTLIEMLDMITKIQMSTGNRPITIMCNDGVGRSGAFLCIHSQLERLKTEGVVDVFQAVKSSRIQRGYLMPETHQFAYTHQVLADYMDKFDNYANFKDMI